jgi:hypothetical protein
MREKVSLKNGSCPPPASSLVLDALTKEELYGKEGEEEIAIMENFIDEGFRLWLKYNDTCNWPVVPLRL